MESSAISDILGHTSPETVKHYLQADLKDLRKCALEVDRMSVEFDCQEGLPEEHPGCRASAS
uniref:hypothetical protein n=1 Tax=Enterocloster clostridioformis TaxID=1531 RepID=UPI001F3A3FA7|nr:hypothetical protein [Enterocloster clostridioformis]